MTASHLALAAVWLLPATDTGGARIDFDLALPALSAAARQDLRLALLASKPWPHANCGDLFRAAAWTNPEEAVKFADPEDRRSLLKDILPLSQAAAPAAATEAAGKTEGFKP